MRDKPPPFRKGQLVRSERGIVYRVTREYVPPEPGYFDLRCFEMMRVSPHEPFRMAASMADLYEPVEERC